MDLRRLVLLHSNDMHGDFFDERQHDKMVGGLSLLSGYISACRRDFDDTIYVISGDMLQGCIIDTEYKGISTIDLINMINPDCATLGNHEADYGLGHLMFLERCAKFPIINANLFIRPTGTRLFRSHYILERNGIRILFIGIITEEVLQQGKADPLLGTFVNVQEASREIEVICNAYKDVDIDLTVILTHIGFEEDIKLAQAIKPELGVDLIIGGHSHTYLDEPAEVNNILIAQAGVGTDHIGRFDLVIDMDRNSVHEYTWELVPIDHTHCERDLFLEEVLNKYKAETDEKYNRLLTRFKRVLHHEDRYRETALGNLFADIFRQQFGVDIYLLGSGSIRKDRLGELVTYGDLKECFPYEESVHAMTVKGRLLKEMLHNFWSKYGAKETHEFYQYSDGLHSAFDRDSRSLIELLYRGEPIADEDEFVIGLPVFHLNNCFENFGVTREQLAELRPIRTVCTNSSQVLTEYLSTHSNLDSSVKGRILMYKER